jgi:hypothetical protein
VVHSRITQAIVMRTRLILLVAASVAISARADPPPRPADPTPMPAAEIDAIHGWGDVERFLPMLESYDAPVRRAAVRALIRMRRTAPDGDDRALRAVDPRTRERIADWLVVIDDTQPEFRRDLLDVVTTLAPDSEVIIPLLIRAASAAGADADTRAAAERVIERQFTATASSAPRVVRALVVPMLRNDASANAVSRRILARLGPAARPLAAGQAVALIAWGYGNPATELLKEFGGDPDAPLARLALRIRDVRPTPRSSLVRLFDAIADRNLGAAQAADALALDPSDRGSAERVKLAAQILAAADPALDAPAAALDSIIAQGVTPAPFVIGALDLSPTTVRRTALPHLAAPRTDVRAAALAVLRSTDPADPATRRALTVHLKNRFEDVRLAAAEMLGDPRSMNLARLPGWLADLRADSGDRRALAARQLETSGLLPPDLSAALVRAVDRRDLAAREGLLLAVERVTAKPGPARDALQSLAAAEADPATRAYARAALRELDR